MKNNEHWKDSVRDFNLRPSGFVNVSRCPVCKIKRGKKISAWFDLTNYCYLANLKSMAALRGGTRGGGAGGGGTGRAGGEEGRGEGLAVLVLHVRMLRKDTSEHLLLLTC